MHSPGLVVPGVTVGAVERSPAGAAIVQMANDLAGPEPLASTHLLRALVTVPDSVALHVPTSLGITSERVLGALAATPVEGTSDETPDQVMARSVSIRAEKERVVIELLDPELARLLSGFGEDPTILAGGLAQLLEQVRAGLERAARSDEEPGASTDE